MTDGTVHIREAVPSDSGAIRRVHRESILELGVEAYDKQQVEAWADGTESADYTAGIESGAEYFVVPETDSGEVVGFGSITFESPEAYEADVDAEVTGVYVHPAVAGEGVGSRLCETLEAAARDRGTASIGLWASRNAVSFYESHGYERVRERTHEFSADVAMTVVEMHKQL